MQDVKGGMVGGCSAQICAEKETTRYDRQRSHFEIGEVWLWGKLQRISGFRLLLLWLAGVRGCEHVSVRQPCRSVADELQPAGEPVEGIGNDLVE
ncbi:MAG: hypothetical protein RLZZ232_2501 [Planctomycetota bacterium]|jgi:hypothetical protein